MGGKVRVLYIYIYMYNICVCVLHWESLGKQGVAIKTRALFRNRKSPGLNT